MIVVYRRGPLPAWAGVWNVFWIQVEPLLSGVARNVGKEETGCQKERLIVGHLLDHANGLGSDVVIAFGRIVIVVRPTPQSISG